MKNLLYSKNNYCQIYFYILGLIFFYFTSFYQNVPPLANNATAKTALIAVIIPFVDSNTSVALADRDAIVINSDTIFLATKAVDEPTATTILTIVGQGTSTANSNGKVTFVQLPTFLDAVAPICYTVLCNYTKPISTNTTATT